jgi:hypothetical protein
VKFARGCLLTRKYLPQCRKYGCADDEGQHNVAYKRSTDRGATFSAIQMLLDPMKMFPPSQCPTDSASVHSQNHSCQFWDPTPVVDRQTGVVFLLTTFGGCIACLDCAPRDYGHSDNP